MHLCVCIRCMYFPWVPGACLDLRHSTAFLAAEVQSACNLFLYHCVLDNMVLQVLYPSSNCLYMKSNCTILRPLNCEVEYELSRSNMSNSDLSSSIAFYYQIVYFPWWIFSTPFSSHPPVADNVSAIRCSSVISECFKGGVSRQKPRVRFPIHRHECIGWIHRHLQWRVLHRRFIRCNRTESWQFFSILVTFYNLWTF